MKKNIGTKDRLLRGAIGLILLCLSWWFQSWVLLGIGLFSLYEAVAGWCAFYQLLGKNTCPL